MTPTSRLLTAVALTATALLLAACGASDEEDVQSAVKGFASAVKDKDYGKACETITADARKALEGAAPGDSGCEGVIKQVNEAGGLEGLPSNPDDIEFDKTEVNGDTATVKLKGDETGDTRMKKEDGEWKLDVN
jgi:hypothetical protein